MAEPLCSGDAVRAVDHSMHAIAADEDRRDIGSSSWPLFHPLHDPSGRRGSPIG